MRRSDIEAIEAAIETDPEEAINLIAVLMDEGPADADLQALLGEAQEAAGLLETALGTWGRYLEMDPDWPEAYTRRAEILMNLGRREAADAELQVARDLFPEDGRVLWSQGLWHDLGGEEASAMDLYRQATRADPMLSVPAHFPLETAERVLKKALRGEGLDLELQILPEEPGEEGLLRTLDLPSNGRCVVYLRNLERELEEGSEPSELVEVLLETLGASDS